MNTEVGKTKDAGFQFGARKTFDLDFHKAWDFLFSKEGLKVWLGSVEFNELETKNGICFV